MQSVIFAVKIAGALLMIGSAYCLGRRIKKEYGERTRLLSSLQNALKQMDNQIMVSGRLLEDALQSCGNTCFPEEGGKDLFTAAAEKIAAGSRSVAEAWCDAVDTFPKGLFLKEEDKQTLKDLGSGLGSADSARQSVHIAKISERLHELEQSAADKEKKDGGIVIKLCVAVSAVTAILLF